MDIRWQPTGSSVSGCGYGYAIYSDGEEFYPCYAVRLAFGSCAALVPCETRVDAVELGEAFCHAWSQWQVVAQRARALGRGIAVVGN